MSFPPEGLQKAHVPFVRPTESDTADAAANSVDPTEAMNAFGQCAPGVSDEWHLNHDKPFRHIAFELGAGFSQVREVPVVSFPSPGLVAIWAVGDAVGGDGVE